MGDGVLRGWSHGTAARYAIPDSGPWDRPDRIHHSRAGFAVARFSLGGRLRSLRIAALLVALFTIAIGIGGLVSPDSGTEIRRLYFATPVRLYTAGAVRVAMGLVVILAAAASRAPKTLRALGAVMCMQGLVATLMGPDHARAILEWEATQGTALLRVGAAVALAAGVFLAFALTGHRPSGTT